MQLSILTTFSTFTCVPKDNLRHRGTYFLFFISNYLFLLPVRAGIIFEPQHYVYSSAIDYYTNQKGIINIKLLQ